MKQFDKCLKNLLNEINIEINIEQINKFYDYMNLLLKWNEKINLTTITEQNEVILKHFVDSLTILKYIDREKKLVDVGTGAGFPGIPIAIMREENQIVLVDSLNKRINFLNEIKERLQLKNIESIHRRVEDFAHEKNHREKYDIAVSRAVANMSVLVEYLLPMVRFGGQVICMKGSQIDDEIEQSKYAIKKLGGIITKQEEIYLPQTDIKRNIIIIEKIKSTPNEYPRKAGIPSKNPLK